MKIEVLPSQKDNRVAPLQVFLEGKVDSSNASQLGKALIDWLNAGYFNIFVYMDRVDYLSTHGFMELSSLMKICLINGGHMSLVMENANGNVQSGGAESSAEFESSSPHNRVWELLEMYGQFTAFDILDPQHAAQIIADLAAE